VCISWTIKCLILLMHGATVKFTHTRLYLLISGTSMQFVVFVRWAAIIDIVQPFAAAQIQLHRSTQSLIPKCKYYSAYKKVSHFHSLIYPLPIFTCPKSFAGYCNCAQGGTTSIMGHKPNCTESLLTSSHSIKR